MGGSGTGTVVTGASSGVIVSLADMLQFLEMDNQYFVITAGNDTLVLTSDLGGPCNIDVADGTYDGTAAATALQTAMNANATLTGGVITFVVAYSTTAYKFTIDATVGRTIAYTHTGSDAGYTFGFTANAAAAQTITSDTAAGDPTDYVQNILTEAESFVSNYCRRTFESTAYTLERYNGKGHKIINLKQYPATLVDRVCIGTRHAIGITNTTNGTSASVSVLTTGLRLILNGSVDATDVTFATNTTVGSIVTAVNTIGSGWSATLENSDYSTFKSTDLITQSASGCINRAVVYLSIPGIQEPHVNVDLDRGQIRLYSGFYEGFQNVFVDYTAGYSDADMPDDLKLAVKIIVQYIFEKAKNTVFGIDFYNIGASGSTGLRTIFEKQAIPKDAQMILNNYKAWRV